MEERIHPVIEYCESRAVEFNSRINRIRSFVSHNLTSGTANEAILRDFLAQHAPANFEVAQGFIVDLFSPMAGARSPSKQCDILVFDRAKYPVLYSEGPIKIVHPDAARMVTEVKTKLNKSELKDALANIASAKRLTSAKGIIFSFRSPSMKTVLSYLKDCPYRCHRHSPDMILLFDKGIVIYSQQLIELPNGQAESLNNPALYNVAKSAKYKDGTLVVALLYLLFLNAVHHDPCGYDSLIRGILCAFTQTIHEGVVLGQESLLPS